MNEEESRNGQNECTRCSASSRMIKEGTSESTRDLLAATWRLFTGEACPFTPPKAVTIDFNGFCSLLLRSERGKRSFLNAKSAFLEEIFTSNAAGNRALHTSVEKRGKFA